MVRISVLEWEVIKAQLPEEVNPENVNILRRINDSTDPKARVEYIGPDGQKVEKEYSMRY